MNHQHKNLASNEENVAVLPARSFQILTLLDMLEFLAYAEDQRGKQSPLKPEELDDLRHKTSILAEELKKTGVTIFEATLSRINEIREDSNDDPAPVLGSINRQLRRLREDLERDLHKQLFMSLEPKEIVNFNQKERFGPDVKAKFPNANQEITNAGTCYAINNYTGCVFHLMRAVEYGARAMLKEFGVVETRDHRPIELGDWGDFSAALNAELAKLSIGKRKDAQKTRDVEFYSYPIQEFEKFRIWRNKVSHLREEFLPGQTEDLMDATQRYMRHLATELDE